MPSATAKSKKTAKPEANGTPAKPRPLTAQQWAEQWKNWPTQLVKVGDISVEDRYRKDLGDISSLKSSIASVGLLQPLVVNKADGRLIAGQRRLEACKQLGLAEVPCRLVDPRSDMDPLVYLLQAELEENEHRLEPSLKERVARIQQIERLLGEVPPIVTAKAPDEKSPQPSRRQRVARAMGMSHESIRQAKVIVGAATNDPAKFGHIQEKVDAQQMSIQAAYKEVTAIQQSELDKLGVPVHQKVAAAFLAVPNFEELARACRTVAKGVQDIASAPGGERFAELFTAEGTEGFKLRHSDAGGELESVYSFTPLFKLIAMLTERMPHCQCPLCFAEAGELGKYRKKCPACGGSGHIGVKQIKALQDSDDKSVPKLLKLAKTPGK